MALGELAGKRDAPAARAPKVTRWF